MLFRLLLLTPLLFLNLYACKGGYTSCIQKAKDSASIHKTYLSIPLSKKRRLIYAHATPNATIIKSDPFLNLYLVKDRHPFAYPYDVNMRLQLGLAMVTDKSAQEGRIIQNQIGLNHLAHFSEKLLYPALLTSSCCSLEGIVTQEGIIQKEYLHHFVTSKRGGYGDIGIRVMQKKHQVIVNASDPFMKHNPFKQGDCVTQFDGRKVGSASTLMRKILFSKVGKKHKVRIKRGAKTLNFTVVTKKRYCGGALSDTFLERYGIYFDQNLHITRLGGRFLKYGLHIGDKLLQVNGMKISNQEQLRHYIENFKDYSSLLFERDNFQFFVNIK